MMMSKKSTRQVKATSRGASRQAVAVRGESGRIRRWLFACIAVSFVGAGSFFGVDTLRNVFDRPVANIMVEGEFQFVSQAEVMALITPQIDSSFLRLPLDTLKLSLEAQPWIDRVSLGRRWPDKLVVKIVEQQPIARWENTVSTQQGFLNQRGDVVSVSDVPYLQTLPLLSGAVGQEREVMQQYQDLSQLLRSRNLDVAVLRCDEKKAWQIELKNSLKILIGRDQVMDKMHRFLTVYDASLRSNMDQVVLIDARYSNGVSVQWREVVAQVALGGSA